MSPQTPTRSWTADLSDRANLASAAKWGVITAAAYIVIGFLLDKLSIALTVPGQDATQNPLAILPACLIVFALAFAIYAAGYLPALERNNVATGLAGSVIMFVLLALENVIMTHIQGKAGTTVPGNSSTSFISTLLAIVIGLGLVLAVGWTGAFQGVKQNTKRMLSKTPSPKA